MKKFCLTLGAALIGLSSFASQRTLYQQDFETAVDAAATGWEYGGASMNIVSDDFGKSLQIALGQNNGRSGQCVWGSSIFVDPTTGESLIGEDGIYYLNFDFAITVNSNNQYNSEITIFTNHSPKTNETYRLPWTPSAAGPWNNFVFDLSQCNTAADADMLATINAPLKSETKTDDEGTETTTYSIDTATQYTISTGAWYTVSLKVNTLTREVEYAVAGLDGNELTSGTLTVPEADKNDEPISMLAEGIYAMTARYQTTMQFDNFKIYVESDQDFANLPTVALTRLGKTAEDVVDLNLRAYTITFGEEETLHVTGTNGQTVEVEHADCDGAYVYETTESGTLTAWTTCGTATSEKVEVKVECVPCVLPAATATISAVEAGFAKTYTLSVSNTEVPLQPTIFIAYEFKGVDGTTFEKSDLASGASVTLPCEGTLTLTTSAFGYQQTSTDVINDLEFELKKEWDFARMDDATVQAAGFPSTYEITNTGATSGWSNWTGRMRLFYYDLNAPTGEVDDAGNPLYAKVLPFGFVSEDNTTNVIEACGLGADVNVAGKELFEGITLYAGHNVTFMKHLGMVNNETTGGNNKNIDVLNLDKSDFVVANLIGNYGGNSCHPIVATVDEYYAQLVGEGAQTEVGKGGTTVIPAVNGTEITTTEGEGEAAVVTHTGIYNVSIPVYRIETVCTYVKIFAQKGGSGIEAIGADAAVENNDPYYYTIDGIRVAEPTRPGLYIHKGKKLIIK